MTKAELLPILEWIKDHYPQMGFVPLQSRTYDAWSEKRQLATDGVEDDPEGYSFWMSSSGSPGRGRIISERRACSHRLMALRPCRGSPISAWSSAGNAEAVTTLMGTPSASCIQPIESDGTKQSMSRLCGCFPAPQPRAPRPRARRTRRLHAHSPSPGLRRRRAFRSRRRHILAVNAVAGHAVERVKTHLLRFGGGRQHRHRAGHERQPQIASPRWSRCHTANLLQAFTTSCRFSSFQIGTDPVPESRVSRELQFLIQSPGAGCR
jgi:hypothetical protein